MRVLYFFVVVCLPLRGRGRRLAPVGAPPIAPAASMGIQQRMSLLNDMLQSPHILNRCDLQRMKGLEFSAEEFKKEVRARNQTVLVTGAVDLDAEEVRELPLDRDAFLASFGHFKAGASNGRFDDGRKSEDILVSELLSLPAYDLKFFLAGESCMMHGEILRRIKPLIPSYLDDFCARPILSVGTRTTTTWFHNHDETWFMLAAGRKAWWVGDPSVPLGEVERIDPCSLLEASDLPAGIRFFVQQPGELLYLPDHVVHATFNLDNFTFGFGAQGHTETWPPMLRAAQKADLVEVQQLLAAGEEVNAVNPEGENAVHRAAWRGDLDIAKILLEQRADPNLVGIEGASKGATPLHVAAVVGWPSVVDALLSHGADPNVQGLSTGQRPLHLAAKEGHLDVVKALVGAGGHSRGRSANGGEPLHHAALAGHLDIIEWLVEEADADINVVDDDGATAAHYAAIEGRVDILEFAQDCGADLEVPDGEGVTPMEYTMAKGHQAATEFFLESFL